MIHTRAEELTSLVLQVKTFSEVKTVAARLQSKTEQLHRDRERIQRSIDTLQLLRQRGVTLNDTEAEALCSAALRAIREATSNLDNLGAEFIESDESGLQGIMKSLPGLADSLASIAQTAWGGFVGQRMPSDHSDVLKAFGVQQREAVQRLTALRANMRRIWAAPATTLESVLEFESAVVEYNSEFEKLIGANVSDNVLDFLRKAGTSEGVSLNALTPEVMAWLSERNMADAFRIRL